MGSVCKAADAGAIVFACSGVPCRVGRRWARLGWHFDQWCCAAVRMRAMRCGVVRCGAMPRGKQALDREVQVRLTENQASSSSVCGKLEAE